MIWRERLYCDFKMKVLHLINTLSAGGAELHLLTLCRHLKTQGVDSVIGYLKEGYDGSRCLRPECERQAFRSIDLLADRRYEWRVFGRIGRLLRAEQPDILHTHLPRADFAGAVGRLLYRRIPWVCSVHDIYSRSWSGSWTLPLFDRLWRRADAIIAISHAVKDWLIQERRVPADNVTVIHYGIEPQRFAQPQPTSDEQSSAHRQAVVGTIGRLEPRKGHEYLIRAMPDVLRWVPQATLRVAGHDPWGYGSTLQAVVAELGVEAQVRLVGFISDVPAFLHALDVFALASRSEGFGQVVIEAMAAGKPVVASRIAPLTEIVVDGDTGLLVEPENPKAFAEAIVWLLTHPDAAQRMGRRGQERVRQHFSAEQMAAKTLALYQQVLSARR
jgi:glycosyltransferase involved in cell wall biosynthesis